MGRAKSGIAAAGVIVMLLGVGTVLFMQGKGDSNHANSVVASTSDKAQPAVVPILPTMAPASSPATTVAPSAQAKGTTPTTKLDSTPSAQEIQQVIAGLTVQLQQTAAANGSGTPLTKEQVEAQLRLMLKQLGIPYPAS
jgi:hypothetical protein